MANTANNPTTGQGGTGIEGDQTAIQPSAPMISSAILWWALGLLVSLGLVWLFFRVASRGWHLSGK